MARRGGKHVVDAQTSARRTLQRTPIAIVNSIVVLMPSIFDKDDP
jgi:hypothetical protein